MTIANVEIIDVFSQVSTKIAFLLDTAPDATVLLIGDHALEWETDFKNYFSVCDTCETLSDEIEKLIIGSSKYDLIVWDATSHRNYRCFKKNLRLVDRHLKEYGCLICFASKGDTFHRLMSFLRYRKIEDGGAGLSAADIKGLLSQAGFGVIRKFIPLPSLEDMEEIVNADIGDFQLPGYYPLLLRIANKMGLYNNLHTQLFLIATKNSNDGIHKILNRLEDELSAEDRREIRLLLERFDLRERGALLLFVADQLGMKHVVRVATHPAIDRIIKQNTIWTHRIYSDYRISEWLRNLIPAPLAKFDWDGRFVYVERRLPGVLAWKVAKIGRIEKKIFKDSKRLIDEFNRTTQRELQVDEGLFDVIVKKDIDNLRGLLIDELECPRAFDRVQNYLKEILINRKCSIVIGHGDYGYGNILVDPFTGNLSGVIDWDRAREFEMYGVDLLNLIIQRERICYGETLVSAFTKVAHDIRVMNKSSLREKYFNDHMRQENLMAHLGIALYILPVRFISRAATYWNYFIKNKQMYVHLLHWLDIEITGQIKDRNNMSGNDQE